MALTVIKKGEVQTPLAQVAEQSLAAQPPASAQPKKGQARKLSVDGIRLDIPMRLRTGHMLAIFGVSGAQFYKLRKAGKIPAPAGHIGTGKRPTPYWITTEIAPYI
ncbi:MAG: hypothetical protein J0H09_23465 [Burkholderiales bacterium]|nr:hypothetical protein [Burkholderiales bacterium]